MSGREMAFVVLWAAVVFTAVTVARIEVQLTKISKQLGDILEAMRTRSFKPSMQI